MEKKFNLQLLCFSILLLTLSGCSYTQPNRTTPFVPRGNVIQIFPTQYLIDRLDTAENQEKYIVIDSVGVSEEDAMRMAWSRDGDAYLNVKYRTYCEYRPWMHGLDDYVERVLFSGTMVKYLKYVFPCDSNVITFLFSEPCWAAVRVTKYHGPVVFKFDDEKKEHFELVTDNLEPGIYEVHVRAGDFPLWTHRGTRWDTSRWIEIVK